MAKNSQHFPPVGHEDRFDAIVSKGRKIRHRRQAGFGAATSSVLAACVALVVIFGGNNGASKSDQVFADQGKNTNATPVESTVSPKQMTLQITRDGAQLNIEVNDPRMPVPTAGQSLGDGSYRTQQCILVDLADEAGQTVAEGFGCNIFDPATDPSGSTAGTGVVAVQLTPSDGVSIGCAAVQERMDPVTTEPQPVASLFTADLPSSLASGEYQLTVEAASGFGDGCPDNPESGSAPGAGQPGGAASADGQAENMIAAQKLVTVPG